MVVLYRSARGCSRRFKSQVVVLLCLHLVRCAQGFKRDHREKGLRNYAKKGERVRESALNNNKNQDSPPRHTHPETRNLAERQVCDGDVIHHDVKVARAIREVATNQLTHLLLGLLGLLACTMPCMSRRT